MAALEIKRIDSLRCHSKVTTVAELECIGVTFSMVWLLEQGCSL